VLALSSVGRGAYERFTTCKALSEAVDLEGTGKESGELEYDASIVLALTSDTTGGAPIREALLRVVKNREGSTGDIPMTFDAARGLFRERNGSTVASSSSHLRNSEPPRRGSLTGRF
jgi:replicative DNA helicase